MVHRLARIPMECSGRSVDFPDFKTQERNYSLKKNSCSEAMAQSLPQRTARRDR
jgi:hypothetical protein